MSILTAAMKELDIANATSLARMGMKANQVFDVFSAYFRGAELPRAANASLSLFKNLPTRPFVAAARATLVGGGSLAVWNALPRSNALAIPAGIGAAAGTYAALGRVTQNVPGNWGTGLRIAGGLIAGSLAYQGLRAPQQSDYQVKY